MTVTVVLGGLLIGGCLGLLGSGGSILTVPVLVYMLGHEPKAAIAESLAIVGLIAAVGSIGPVRRRRVDWRSVAFFGVPAMAGTALGAAIAAGVSPIVQMLTFAAVMVSAAVVMLRSTRPRSDAMPRRRRGMAGLAMIIAEGLVVGVVTGFVGVGGGFLVVPALVMLGGLPMSVAVGTSLVIIAIKSASGFAEYALTLETRIDGATIALFAAFGSVGSVAGSHLGERLNERLLKRLFAIAVLLMGSAIAAAEVAALLGAVPPA